MFKDEVLTPCNSINDFMTQESKLLCKPNTITDTA